MAKPKESRDEPRWPALLAITMTCFVFGALPPSLAFGPRWLLMAVVAAIEIPAMLLRRAGHHRLTSILGYIASICITAFLFGSLALLVQGLPAHREEPVQLLRSAASLWLANVLVFALWYWRLDGGGPTGRAQRPHHTEGAFLFAQMTWKEAPQNWSPRFVDYLFISFTTSTAFSPTDAPILSRWAKVLVMLQSLISLGIVILLAARAVNIM